jgi:hypothetical protein
VQHEAHRRHDEALESIPETGLPADEKVAGRCRQITCQPLKTTASVQSVRFSVDSGWNETQLCQLLAAHRSRCYRLMGQMEHTDRATFSRHYHAGGPRAEAKKFWAISSEETQS